MKFLQAAVASLLLPSRVAAFAGTRPTPLLTRQLTTVKALRFDDPDQPMIADQPILLIKKMDKKIKATKQEWRRRKQQEQAQSRTTSTPLVSAKTMQFNNPDNRVLQDKAPAIETDDLGAARNKVTFNNPNNEILDGNISSVHIAGPSRDVQRREQPFNHQLHPPPPPSAMRQQGQPKAVNFDNPNKEIIDNISAVHIAGPSRDVQRKEQPLNLQLNPPPPPSAMRQQQQQQGQPKAVKFDNPNNEIIDNISSVHIAGPSRNVQRQEQPLNLQLNPPPPPSTTLQNASAASARRVKFDNPNNEILQDNISSVHIAGDTYAQQQQYPNRRLQTSLTASLQQAAMSTRATSAESCVKLTDPVQQLLDKTDVFIFDCDGVIWRGDSLIPGIPETLAKLRAAGKKMFFVTNNSTKSRAGYKKKFDKLGLTDVAPQEIFSSSFAAAAYLQQTNFKETGKKVYVIGETGIGEELDQIGIPYIGGPDDADKVPNMGPGGTVQHDSDVGAVVVGFDRYINYYKVQYAQLCLNENEDCEFIATNLDAVTHLTDAQEWAGNGSMVGAIKGCTGREPTVVGKPSPLMIDYLCDTLGLERSRICMVGDRLDTDILFGKDNGLQSLLVLSGVTSLEKLTNPENTIRPDYYADSINDFFDNNNDAAVLVETKTAEGETTTTTEAK